MKFSKPLRLVIACGICSSAAAAAIGSGTEPRRDPPEPAAFARGRSANLVGSFVPATGPTTDDRPGGPELFEREPSRRNLVGLVVPAQQVAVRARVDGLVGGLKRPGDRVDAGDVLALVDDGEAALELERQRSKAAGIAYRCVAATVELQLLQQRAEQLRGGQEKRVAAASEVAQNRLQIEAAAARMKALEEDRKEAQIECRALERRLQSYRCVAPMAGEVSDAARAAGEFVRAGETVMRVQSLRRHVRVNLPADLADRLPDLAFRLAVPGAAAESLVPTTAHAEYNLNGGRTVALDAGAAFDLVVGRTVEVEVVTP